MVTWGDVKSFAANRIEVAELESERVTGTLDGQPIHLEVARAWDEPFLIVSSAVASEEQVTRPIDALRWSAELAVGALVILDGMLVVRATLCMGEVAPAGLERYVAFVAREAARLARLHSAWSAPSRAVDFLVD